MTCSRISDEFGRTPLSRVRVNDASRYDRTHDVLRPASSCSAFNRQSRHLSASASDARPIGVACGESAA
jgi:hypothetical protein